MEDNEKKAFVHIDNYTGEKPIEIIYREDNPAPSPKYVPAKFPDAIEINGIISAPYAWLEKRLGTFDVYNASVIVNREAGCITVCTNERDCHKSHLDNEECVEKDGKYDVTGTICTTKDFDELHINDPLFFWKPKQLAKYLRLHRGLFTDKGKGMELVSLLKNVEAKITGEYNKKEELHGKISRIDYISQNIDHNLPESFSIKLKIFKGSPQRAYDVEIDADIIDGELCINLVSPDICEEVDGIKDQAIDEQLALIRDLEPRLVIIEK